MLIGQSLVAPKAAATNFYTPWFPRGGNAGTIVVEVLHISSASCQISVAMEQKDEDESDAAASSAGSFASAITVVGTYMGALTAAGLKQLVRCKLTILGTGSFTEWVHLRFNAPIWQPN